MLMNLMGVPTDLPLYDPEGNWIPGTGATANDNFYSNEETSEADKELSRNILDQASGVLAVVLETDESLATDTTANLSLSELVKVYSYYDPEGETSEYYSITIHGGENGNGLWSAYLKALSNLLFGLESCFTDVWVRKIEIDCPDDVFELEVALIP